MPEQSLDEEVDRTEVGQFVPRDRPVRVFGKKASEFVDGQGRLEPLPRLRVAYPDAEVGVAALVAGAGMHDLTERGDDEFVGRTAPRRCATTSAGGCARRRRVRFAARRSRVVPSW